MISSDIPVCLSNRYKKRRKTYYHRCRLLVDRSRRIPILGLGTNVGKFVVRTGNGVVGKGLGAMAGHVVRTGLWKGEGPTVGGVSTGFGGLSVGALVLTGGLVCNDGDTVGDGVVCLSKAFARGATEGANSGRGGVDGGIVQLCFQSWLLAIAVDSACRLFLPNTTAKATKAAAANHKATPTKMAI